MEQKNGRLPGKVIPSPPRVLFHPVNERQGFKAAKDDRTARPICANPPPSGRGEGDARTPTRSEKEPLFQGDANPAVPFEKPRVCEREAPVCLRLRGRWTCGRVSHDRRRSSWLWRRQNKHGDHVASGASRKPAGQAERAVLIPGARGGASAVSPLGVASLRKRPATSRRAARLLSALPNPITAIGSMRSDSDSRNIPQETEEDKSSTARRKSPPVLPGESVPGAGSAGASPGSGRGPSCPRSSPVSVIGNYLILTSALLPQPQRGRGSEL
ncbi:hypothetical protein AAFF_G00275290 [Aldrovandia affinis]|uniref:Uncharacterized protein n=1 Tax=Aldrovandia affinis TaxID=143900 RepID=A0AAD7SRT5_9TELE|nr:hypothetical protein AAFF_G00275290 [Aldrovandia affinis]